LVLQSAGAADTLSKQIAARTELYQIQTLTLSDQQFLKGDTGGKPVTITGQLRIAQGSGRLPVVVLQHGSGVTPQTSTYAQENSTNLASRPLLSIISPDGGSRR
jgi:hypothetical protein